MPLSVQDRLVAELNVLPEDLGLDGGQFQARMDAWVSLSKEQQADPARRYALVKALLLRSWITALSREVDRFRAEGELTIELNVLGRIELLKADLLQAQVEAAGESSSQAVYGPVVSDWGVS